MFYQVDNYGKYFAWKILCGSNVNIKKKLVQWKLSHTFSITIDSQILFERSVSRSYYSCFN